jgi:penicillin-binding protein 2
MVKGKIDKGARTASIVCLILSMVLIIRLFQLCIIEGQNYKKLAESNHQRIIPLEPLRGIIFDRNGIPLVKNMPYFLAVLNIGGERNSSGDINSKEIDEIARLLNISPDEIKERLKNRPSTVTFATKEFEPVVIKEGLTFEEVARIEARHTDFPNLSVTTTAIRRYLYGSVGAHLIGYIGRINEKQWESLRHEGVPPDAFIGQWGIEKIYDKELRGIFGKRIIEVDAFGNELKVLRDVPPVKGKDIRLTIDIELQKALEEAYGEKAGAFVAIKPDTGEILALGSLPSFDPNRFSRGAPYGYWRQLVEDSRAPLLNRAFQSQYPPGSVFKIVTAIAGLEEGIIKPSTTFHCSGGIPFGNRFFRCWKKEGHGQVDLKRALVESCDVYFYEVGKRVGIDKIAKYAMALGLGKASGINLVSEKKGVVPSSEWKLRATGQPWFAGETLSASIGQGYVSATPIQLARLIAIIANDGSMPDLKIILPEGPQISNGVSSEIDRQKFIGGNNPSYFKMGVGISRETLEFIKEALIGVVNEPGGTGGAARLPGIVVAGKTGTAQVISKAIETHKLSEKLRDHAWFVAFAPAREPQIAMAVFVEHGGHGGSGAAPIARKGIEIYFKGSVK